MYPPPFFKTFNVFKTTLDVTELCERGMGISPSTWSPRCLQINPCFSQFSAQERQKQLHLCSLSFSGSLFPPQTVLNASRNMSPRSLERTGFSWFCWVWSWRWWAGEWIMPVQRPYRVGPIQVLQKQPVKDRNVLQSPVTSVAPPLASLSHLNPHCLGSLKFWKCSKGWLGRGSLKGWQGKFWK